MSPFETSLRNRIAVVAVTTLVLNLAYSLPALAKPYKPAGAQKVWPGQSIVDVQLPDARSRQLGLDGPQQVAGPPLRVRS